MDSPSVELQFRKYRKSGIKGYQLNVTTQTENYYRFKEIHKIKEKLQGHLEFIITDTKVLSITLNRSISPHHFHVLEFLGDAALLFRTTQNLVSSKIFMTPFLLTRMRTRMQSNRLLGKIYDFLELDKFVKFCVDSGCRCSGSSISHTNQVSRKKSSAKRRNRIHEMKKITKQKGDIVECLIGEIQLFLDQRGSSTGVGTARSRKICNLFLEELISVIVYFGEDEYYRLIHNVESPMVEGLQQQGMNQNNRQNLNFENAGQLHQTSDPFSQWSRKRKKRANVREEEEEEEELEEEGEDNMTGVEETDQIESTTAVEETEDENEVNEDEEEEMEVVEDDGHRGGEEELVIDEREKERKRKLDRYMNEVPSRKEFSRSRKQKSRGRRRGGRARGGHRGQGGQGRAQFNQHGGRPSPPTRRGRGGRGRRRGRNRNYRSQYHYQHDNTRNFVQQQQNMPPSHPKGGSVPPTIEKRRRKKNKKGKTTSTHPHEEEYENQHEQQQRQNKKKKKQKIVVIEPKSMSKPNQSKKEERVNKKNKNKNKKKREESRVSDEEEEEDLNTLPPFSPSQKIKLPPRPRTSPMKKSKGKFHQKSGHQNQKRSKLHLIKENTKPSFSGPKMNKKLFKTPPYTSKNRKKKKKEYVEDNDDDSVSEDDEEDEVYEQKIRIKNNKKNKGSSKKKKMIQIPKKKKSKHHLISPKDLKKKSQFLSSSPRNLSEKERIDHMKFGSTSASPRKRKKSKTDLYLLK